MLLSSIYPPGVYLQGVEGKHRSTTGSGGGGGESAAVGLDQCLGDGQTDTGPAVVPTAGGTPR